MSDVIGLDLVELRAKLRGWHVERRASEHGTEEVYVARRDIEQSCTYWIGQDHYRGGPALRRTYAWPWAIELTRPRLTLADIVAHPPERWDCAPIGVDGRCVFSQRFGNGSVEVYIGGSGPSRLMLLGDMSVLDSLAAHQAIADLLVLLGEVAP